MVVNGPSLFAGTGGSKVYWSTDDGQSWVSSSGGITDSYIYSLYSYGANIFAGAANAGVFRRPLSEFPVSIEELSGDVPRNYSLAQNYPNPFGSTTRFSFSIPEESTVTLKVLDLNGKEIATLFSKRLSPGNYSEEWDAGNLASGVYFYRLAAGDLKVTKKMILVR